MPLLPHIANLPCLAEKLAKRRSRPLAVVVQADWEHTRLPADNLKAGLWSYCEEKDDGGWICYKVREAVTHCLRLGRWMKTATASSWVNQYCLRGLEPTHANNASWAVGRCSVVGAGGGLCEGSVILPMSPAAVAAVTSARTSPPQCRLWTPS